jgi:hypothetical protein
MGVRARALLGVAVLVGACGSPDASSGAGVTTTNATVSPLPLGPPPSPECEEGTELARGKFASGAGVRITQTVDGGSLCLVMEQWGSKQVPLPGEERGPTAPQVRAGGSAGNGVGWFHLFALPDGFPDVTVLDEAGAPLTSARSSDGRYLLIFDGTVGESAGQSSTPVAREFTAVRADGSPVTKLAVMSLPRGSAPADIRQVRNCLRREGLNILEPPMHYAGNNEATATLPPGPPPADALPLPADTSRVAWARCRDLFVAFISRVGLPAAEAQKMLAKTDCMIDKGWVSVIDVGNPFDGVAADAAWAACPV